MADDAFKVVWSARGKVYDPILDSGRRCIFAGGEYLYPEEALEDIPSGATVRVTIEVLECAHNWVDARNKVISSGEVCLKCGAIRAGNATTDAP
jgi:hypothetical protein